ncbi:MAG: SxtJ family membrane protein [Candidatus Sumerlaeia bacterium]
MLFYIDWNPDRRQMRNFGLVMLGCFLALGGLLQWHLNVEGWLPFYICGGIGLFMALSAFLLPGSLGLILYKVWMAIGVGIGFIVAPILISLFYFLVVTPIGLLLRLFGHDPMQRKKGDRESFWIPLEYRADRRHYERQF